MTFKDLDQIGCSDTTLPATLSGLLAAAVHDARKLNRAIYVPNCDQWHHAISYSRTPLCEVCLGGCLIAGTLNVNSCDSVTASMFDDRTSILLDALDDMRIGYWISAFKRIYDCDLKPSQRSLLERIPVPVHTEFKDWEQFDAHLKSLERIIPRLRQVDELVHSS